MTNSWALNIQYKEMLTKIKKNTVFYFYKYTYFLIIRKLHLQNTEIDLWDS